MLGSQHSKYLTNFHAVLLRTSQPNVALFCEKRKRELGRGQRRLFRAACWNWVARRQGGRRIDRAARAERYQLSPEGAFARRGSVDGQDKPVGGVKGVRVMKRQNTNRSVLSDSPVPGRPTAARFRNADAWSKGQTDSDEVSRGDRPSPLVLSQIIDRFGIRSGPTTNLTGFLLRGCRATAFSAEEQATPVEIDIRALGFSEIQFTGHGRFNVGAPLEIVLGSLGKRPQRWRCQVIRAEPCAETLRRVVARFICPRTD